MKLRATHPGRPSARRRASPTLSVLALLAISSLCLTVGCRSRQPQVVAMRPLDFNQDVQPILARNCFSCHGPDPEMRKAGLRLDLEESARKKREGHPDALVPGHPDESELIKRIESRDPHHLMPQSSEGEAKPMKPEEIAILREWVKEGAVYRPHWAFEKPKRPPLPELAKEDRWVRNPIDAFVLARMQKDGLHPSPEADKATLIRRVTLDLTGLLPTPVEVAAFEKDQSPDAYEHLVDRLLARPSYGEHRARYWLDYARYSDTYGLHYDNHRYIWPYRDYLIRAFNTNKPFDQFAKEQIAGDLLPAKNLDPLIASGYVRMGVSSNEGGTINEELRVDMARERTEAFGATFMGLTVGCAVCHDHKYDPTTQKDFYALTAFFNNVDEVPFNGDRPTWAPLVRIPKSSNEEAYNRVLAKRSALAVAMNAARRDEHKLVAKWIESHQDAPQSVSTDKLMLRLRLDEGGGQVIRNSAPHAQPASFDLGSGLPVWGESTWLWPDFRMSTTTHVLLGQTGDFETNQAFSSGGWFQPRWTASGYVDSTTGTLLAKMDAMQHSRGWALSIEKGYVTIELSNEMPRELEAPKDKKAQAKKPEPPKETFRYPTPGDLTAKDLERGKPDQKPDEKKAEVKPPAEKTKPQDKKAEPPADPTPLVALEVTTVDRIPINGDWEHVFFTYDGSGKAAGVKVFVNGAQVATRVNADALGQASIRTQAPMQLGARSPDEKPLRETRYQDIRLYGRALSADEVKRTLLEDYVSELVAKPIDTWNEDEGHAVGEYYLGNVDRSAIAMRAQMKQLDAELDKLSAGGDLTQVAWERPSIAYAHVLTRGVYTARTERVEANTPHYLPPLPAGEMHNRLALAEWTVSPENPLTARVTVNRMWNELFGAGLVETTEDFGIMGQRPSHPELLDWLAVEFRESGWDMKHMYKLMVMSSTYRQSAKSTPEQLARDPKNQLLSHGPRFRMDAEMLRDIALQAGGLLVTKIGGPSVKPYQPQNVWEQVSYPSSDTLVYTQQHGEALYRRSMYTFWKRMADMPDMDAFDAPMRDVVCTRRQRTDTPLQALVTMNDVQWVEAARALAERALLQGGKRPEQRIALMSEILLAHDPSPQTAAVLEKSLAQMEKHYSADPAAAHKLVEVGEKPRAPSIPETELAAWTMVASEMLNLDETLTK
jgi:hypothetical protein